MRQNAVAVVKLADVLRNRSEFIIIDDLSTYRRLTAQLHAKGVVPRDEIDGLRIKTKKQQVCKSGDFLVAEIDAKVGGFGIVPPELDGSIVSSHYFLFEVNKARLDPQYFNFFIKTEEFQKQIVARGSTNYASIRPADILQLEMPLPPINEQQRLVAEIDSHMKRINKLLLLRIDRDIETLWKSILKKAFTGKLVSRESRAGLSREVHNHIPDRHVTAVGENKRNIPILDGLDLSSLPEGWLWTELGTLTVSMKNGIYKPAQFYSEDGVACLRMYNIENGLIVLNNIKRMTLTAEEKQEFRLKPGDLLVNRVNSRELVGKAAVIPAGLEDSVYESKNIRLRLREDCVNSQYVNLWLNSYGRLYISHHFQQTCGQASINQRQLQALPIPLPPVEEQYHIVAKIEELRAKILQVTQLHMQIETDLKMLVQSTLNKVTKQSLLKRSADYCQTQLAI